MTGSVKTGLLKITDAPSTSVAGELVIGHASGVPKFHSLGTTAGTFATLEGIQEFTGNKKFSGTLEVPATVTFTSQGSLVKSGAHALTITTTNTTTATFPSGTVTLAQLGAQTFTGLQTFNAGATVASGQTLTLNGATLSGTIAGTPTWSGVQIYTAASGDNLTVEGRSRIWIKSAAVGQSSIVQDFAGLKLTSGGMSAVSKYTPAIQFGTTDPEITTINPKIGATIVGYATEAYNADTSGGMGIEFFATPNAPGVSGALTSVATMTATEINLTKPVTVNAASHILKAASGVVSSEVVASGTASPRFFADAGALSEDSTFLWRSNSQLWASGIDASDSNKWKLTAGATSVSGGTEAITATTAGAVTLGPSTRATHIINGRISQSEFLDTTDTDTTYTAYDPVNYSSIRFSLSAGSDLIFQGIAAAPAGTMLIIDSANLGTITFSNDNAGASSVNRILTTTGSDITITGIGRVLFIYMGSRWKMLSIVQ